MEDAVAKGVEKFPIKDSAGTILYNNAEEVRIAKAKAQAAHDWAVKYNKELAQLKHEMQAIVDKDPRVLSARKEFQTIFANDKGVKAAIDSIEALNGRYATEEQKALYEKLQSLMTFGGAEELSDSEIAEKAKEALKDKKVAADLQAVQDEITKDTKDNGIKTELTREEAIKKFGKSKDEYTKKVVEDAKKDFEKIAKDLKIKNPKLTIAIGALGLGLAGLFGGLAKKKTVPVAEEA